MRYLFFMTALAGLVAGEYEDRFEKIYREKLWGTNEKGEGFSGGGSIFAFSKPYYNYLVKFLREHQITSVVDLGCGDWTFSKHIDWTGIDYKGFDVVGSVIEKNKQKYSSETIQFFAGNFLEEEIPSADLLICKHVLQHMPNRDIFKFIALLPKFKHCLILDAMPKKGSENIEHPITDVFPYWDDRGTDLTMPPFNVKAKKVLYYMNGSMNMLIHVDNT